MSLSVLISDIVTDARQYADMVNTQFVTDQEIVGYIDKAYRQMYVKIVSQGSNFFNTKLDYAIVPQQDTYPLPVDFYRLTGVDLNIDSQNKITLMNINMNERNMLKNVFATAYVNRGWRYWISAENIIFTPAPDNNASFTIWYIPDPVSIISTNQTLVLNPAVVVDYLGVSAAIRCLQKQESDSSVLIKEQADIITQILDATATQDSAFPLRVTDMTIINDQFLINPVIWR